MLSSFPISLSQKIQSTQGIIRKALDMFGDSIGITFNGGKDSTVLLDLIAKEKKIRTFFIPSKHEFPESIEFIKKAQQHWNVSIETIHSSNLIDGVRRVIQDNGLKALFLGVRSTDPEGKQLSSFSSMTDPWPNAVRVSPLLEWTCHDIWTYIDALKLPTNALYSKGYTSIGTTIDTKPNPALFDPATQQYRHARELIHDSQERDGRVKH